MGEISYALEKIWVRHVPSSSVVLGSYISSFHGVRGGVGNKGGGKKRDDNDNDDDDDDHDEEKDKEDEEEREYRSMQRSV